MALALDDAERDRFLAEAHTGIVSTLRADGRPVTLPVWFVVVDGDIYLDTPAQSAKRKRVGRDARGSFLVERGTAWTELSAVHFEVEVSVVEEPDVVDAVRGAMADKYDHHRPPAEELPGAVQAAYADMVVLRLRPVGKVLSWDNAKIRLNRGG